MANTKPIRLIAGLGNPGRDYEATRHNIGFMVVERLAEQLGWPWKAESKFLGRIAKGSLQGNTVLLVEPMTYMNESGSSIRRVIDYYKIAPEELLVVCDDIDIPFATMRLREKGGPGTHNGLRSVQKHVGPQYSRLRLGVGTQKKGALTSHVLGRFSAEKASSWQPSLTEPPRSASAQWKKMTGMRCCVRPTQGLKSKKRHKERKEKVEPRGSDEQRREDQPL